MFHLIGANMKSSITLPLNKVLLITAAMILSAAYAYSQPQYETPPEARNGSKDGFGIFGIGFQLALPRAEYLEHNNHTGYGLGMTLGYDFPESYITAGLDGMFAIYSTQTRQEPWSSTIPDAKLDVETTNQIAAGHLFLRLQPGTGFIRPYVEGDFGFNYLWTDTKVSSRNNVDDKDIATSVDLSDFVISYGVTGGLMLPVWTPDPKDNQELFELLLDLNFKYLFGGEAEYLKEGDKRIENGRVLYNVDRSRTDMYNFRIGLVMRL
jgi:opacity protein-like surface antigen